MSGRYKRVRVIGCGPAGLAAAHAAAGLGFDDIEIYAPGVKTEQRGPLLLQRPIPGITNDHPDGYIRQIVLGGSILDYRDKLYGDINIGINGDVLTKGYHAWKVGPAYDKLWDLYAGAIVPRTLRTAELAQRSHATREHTLWVNTAPRKAFCENPNGHRFRNTHVFISDRATFAEQPEDTIIFNADAEVPWARSSRIFGNEVTEWTQDGVARTGKLLGVHAPVLRQIVKPISTDCTCLPAVLKTGRFGAWRNETWIDTAYYAVRDALISDRRDEEWASIFLSSGKMPESGAWLA